MDPLQLFIFIVLFLLSAFFSGTELALMSLAEHKVEALIKENKFWAKALEKILKNKDRLLITILIWNNLVNTYTAALATTIAISLAKTSGLPQAQAVWIATWIITFLLLMFGEILPKSFATKNAATISLIVAPIYNLLMKILFPIIIIIEFIIKLVTPKGKAEEITEEEIESFVDMWKKAWALEASEHEKIKNILDFSDTQVSEIMTPRVKIEALDNNTTVKEAFDFFINHTHSRIPVFDWTIDKITHFMTIRDILNQDRNKKLSELNLKEVLKVPINQPIDTLLKTFQNSRKHLAIVMDEYGWVAWLVTLEDVMEEIFGEIRDETDREVDDIKKVWKDSLIVESDVIFDEVLENLNLDFEDIWLNKLEFSWVTLGYIITEKLERFPKTWEIITFELCNVENKKCSKIEFKVLEINDSKIWKIEIKKS